MVNSYDPIVPVQPPKQSRRMDQVESILILSELFIGKALLWLKAGNQLVSSLDRFDIFLFYTPQLIGIRFAPHFVQLKLIFQKLFKELILPGQGIHDVNGNVISSQPLLLSNETSLSSLSLLFIFTCILVNEM